MGCDGGTIPRRDELVKVKKRPEQVCIQYVNKINCNWSFYNKKCYEFFIKSIYVFWVQIQNIV